jgi:hypothetical protein
MVRALQEFMPCVEVLIGLYPQPQPRLHMIQTLDFIPRLHNVDSTLADVV